MMTPHRDYRLMRLSFVAFALAAAGWWGAPAAAGDLDKVDSALKLIPENASFFASGLRNREQIEAIAQSNAWAAIMDMPVVKMVKSLYDAKANDPFSGPGQLAAKLKNPETRKVIDLLLDMGSEEIFAYGDESAVDFLELVQNVINASNQGPMVMQISGEAKGQSIQQIKAAAILAALTENIDLIAAPNVVIGFKLKNTDLAKEQLIKLEMLANFFLGSIELTKDRFKKTKVGKYEYLVLELDGGMIPWSQVPLDHFTKLEAEEGDAERIVERLKDAKLVFALGVRDNYLLASIGSSTDCLKHLGGDERLIDRPEFKPLEKFADQRLVSIGYVSEAMNQQINNPDKNINQMVALADALVTAANIDEEQQERITNDIEALAEDVKEWLPEMGAVMGFSFITKQGIEGYNYNWSKFPMTDGSKPLTLTKHVGGNPVFGLIGRQKISPEAYDRFAGAVKKAYGYFKELGLPNIPEDDREKVEQLLEDAGPLIERLDKINREMLLPALADGQNGLVIDARLRSKQFIKSLPATEKAMPMLEPAYVTGVSDAKLLRKACAEYREVVNGLIDVLRDIEGSEVPEWVRIPDPKVENTTLGVIYRFELPEDWGVDEQVAPHVAIGDNVAVLAMSRSHAERLLKPTPLTVGGMLADSERPLAYAVWLNFPGLFDAARPWAVLGAERLAEQPGAAVKPEDAVQQVNTVLDALGAIRTLSGIIYPDDGPLVTHSLMEIRDVEKPNAEK